MFIGIKIYKEIYKWTYHYSQLSIILYAILCTTLTEKLSLAIFWIKSDFIATIDMWYTYFCSYSNSFVSIIYIVT